MNVQIRDRIGKTLDEMLSPDDKLIFRCVDCGLFHLPKERTQLKRPVMGKVGTTWDTFTICPCGSKYYVILDRQQYERTKLRERASASGIIIAS